MAAACYPLETVTTRIQMFTRAWKRSRDGVDSDCDGSDGLGLTGEYGDTWINASFSAPGVRGLQEFLEAGAEHMYVGNSSSGF